MAEITVYHSREEWLKARKSYIGGSDAACVLGLNPWKSNVQLWEEKTGRRKPDDISGKEAVRYGTKAEEHLRELFALDYPEYKVEHSAFAIYTNSRYPWAHASLDGELTDRHGQKGVLEIKTANMSSAAAKAKWKDGIPQNYYCQLLHYLMVTDYTYAILKAQLKYELPGEEPYLQTRHYRIEKWDRIDDITYLAQAERRFAECIKNDTCPAAILPEI